MTTEPWEASWKMARVPKPPVASRGAEGPDSLATSSGLPDDGWPSWAGRANEPWEGVAGRGLPPGPPHIQSFAGPPLVQLRRQHGQLVSAEAEPRDATVLRRGQLLDQ